MHNDPLLFAGRLTHEINEAGVDVLLGEAAGREELSVSSILFMRDLYYILCMHFYVYRATLKCTWTVYIYIYIYTDIHIYIYIYICIYIYLHTYIYTYLHLCTLVSAPQVQMESVVRRPVGPWQSTSQKYTDR